MEKVAAAVSHKLIPMHDLIKMVMVLEDQAAGAGPGMARHVARLVLEAYIDGTMSGQASMHCDFSVLLAAAACCSARLGMQCDLCTLVTCCSA